MLLRYLFISVQFYEMKRGLRVQNEQIAGWRLRRIFAVLYVQNTANHFMLFIKYIIGN